MADVESRYKKPENYVNRELSWLDFDYQNSGRSQRQEDLPFI